MRYVIHKSSRLPSPAGSYHGPTWTWAGIADRYRRFYEDKGEAETLAALLSAKNRVGFEVSEAPMQNAKAGK